MSSVRVIRKMYKRIKLRTNPVCKKCKPLNKNPVSIWQVGKKFNRDKYKLLFVGKTGRGDWGRTNKSGYVYLNMSDIRERFLTYSNPYWSYTREIVTRIYGSPEEGWNRIAFTNIIKCTDTDTVDTTENSVKDNCILKLGVIQKEIEILKPKNVIFYTGSYYDDQIDGLIDNLKNSFKGENVVTLSKRNLRAGSNGNRLKLYQKELLNRKGNRIMRFLITSHPERQTEERFVSNITRWIKD